MPGKLNFQCKSNLLGSLLLNSVLLYGHIIFSSFHYIFEEKHSLLKKQLFYLRNDETIFNLCLFDEISIHHL